MGPSPRRAASPMSACRLGCVVKLKAISTVVLFPGQTRSPLVDGFAYPALGESSWGSVALSILPLFLLCAWPRFAILSFFSFPFCADSALGAKFSQRCLPFYPFFNAELQSFATN